MKVPVRRFHCRYGLTKWNKRAMGTHVCQCGKRCDACVVGNARKGDRLPWSDRRANLDPFKGTPHARVRLPSLICRIRGYY